MSDINLDDYEEIIDVSFDNSNPHLALCSKSQGYSANGWHSSILMKAEDVQITDEIIKALQQVNVKLSFEEFLRRFFGMYSSDAELLTKVLGLETEYENYMKKEVEEEAEEIAEMQDEVDSYNQFFNEKVSAFELLKSVKDIKEIPPEDIVSIINLQKDFEYGVEQFDISFEDLVPESEGVAVLDKSSADDTEVSPSDNLTTTTEEIMDKDDLLKSAEVQALLKAEKEAYDQLIKAKEDALAAATEELTKAAEQLNAYKEKEVAKQKEGFSNFVKSLEFVSEEDRDSVVEVLIKASDVEGFDIKLLVSQLENAQAEITKTKESFVTTETGVETHEEQADLNKATAVAEYFAEKYGNKKFL